MKWLSILGLASTAVTLTVAKQAIRMESQTIPPTTAPPTTPPPPQLCPKQEFDVDYYGNDIKAIYGVSQATCCDECYKILECRAYSFVPASSNGKATCYLKSSAGGQVAKQGVISGQVIEYSPPPAPAKCPVQESNVDYYGNDIKLVNGLNEWECCDECANTVGCVAYTFLPRSPQGKACYLKSSASGKVRKVGAISGVVKDPATPPPPANCPQPEYNIDYYGNDIKAISGITQNKCCDECSSTLRCVAYSFVAKGSDGKSACYLKSSTAGKVAKDGVVSAAVANPLTTAPPTSPPPPAKCPVQQNDVDYYGNDLKTLRSVTQSACCDACYTVDKCVAYSYVPKDWDGKSSCYLKSSTAGKVAKVGVISGDIVQTPPPTTPTPPANCPVQEINVDYYGNDIKNLPGVTQTECCDACGTTAKCVAYSFVAKGDNGKSVCYLKSSTAGKVAKTGVVSGKIKYIPTPANCPNQELNIDYPGNDIKNVKGVTYGQCCDACGATSGCTAFTYVEQNPDGKSVCYLKSGVAKKVTKDGAISGLYACPTASLGKCGSSATGPLCCPSGSFCQPWESGFYQCIPVPETAKCPTVVTGVDFYGGDLEVKYGLLPGSCCEACFFNKDCVVFTFVNENPDGRSACYLKSKLVEQRAKAGAVSGYKVKSPTIPVG